MPNNYRTIWQRAACKQSYKLVSPPTSCTSFANDSSSSCVSAPVQSTSSLCITNDSDSGQIDKQGTLGNLSDSDYQIILDTIGWLNCDIIQQAQVLLHNANLSIEGFQCPTFKPVRNFDMVTSEFIQILSPRE